MKVYLSPSNQTNNLYNDGKHTEQEVCYLIAQKVQDYLSNTNIDVKLGNPHDTIAQRVTQSNSWGADYHIPIHTNAGGGRGCEVFVWKTNLNDTIANKIYENISELTPTSDRGIKTRNDLYEIKYSTGKAIYIECAFHDTEGDWILENVDDIAFAIAHGICNDVKENIKEVVKTPVTTSNDLWRVQLGAFTTKERAEAFAKELQKKYGLTTFVRQ